MYVAAQDGRWHLRCHSLADGLHIIRKLTKPGNIVIVGELFIDEILSEFHKLPKLGEESFARKFRREVGGGAAITAYGLARLGVQVAVIGVVGKEDGSWVTKRLSSCGADVSVIELHPTEPTGLTVSASTREDRAFFSYYGANDRLPQILRKPAVLALMSKAPLVHFACAPDSQLDAPLLQTLRRRRCRISLDVQAHMGWLTKPDNLSIVRQCDMFFPNEQEAEWMSGETGTHRILRALRDKGLRGVGLKLGGKGAALLWRRRIILSDGYAVETVDTTGAGDGFNAGFIYGWLRGDPPQRCLETANMCGALSTRALGGISSFPTVQELEQFEALHAKQKV